MCATSATDRPSGAGRSRAAWVGAASGVALFGLAAWQFDFLGAGLFDGIPHGRNEDWDWQLTLYEVSRLALVRYRELPAWNPFTQGGVPLWANPEAPFLYPGFAWILALGTEPGLKLWILSHQLLLVVGGWLAGRRMGLSPLAAHGAALAAFCSAFIPGFIAVGHVMYLPLGWLPLAWVAARGGRWRLAGLCLALAFLAGGHHLLVYGALWLGLDALGRGLDRRRLRWLVAGLAVNGLLLGLHALAWPLAAALGLLAVLQRPAGLGRALRPVVLAGLLAGLLCASRFTTAPALFARAERLEAQVVTSIADDYDLGRALRVLSGWSPRPSDHEGQNVFWSPVPVLGGLAGMAGLAMARPAVGLVAWTFWNLGWGGATPANLLEVAHRLPGLDHLRVVERYALVWTLFLGWGLGWAADRLVRWRPWTGSALVGAGLAAWLVRAASFPSGRAPSARPAATCRTTRPSGWGSGRWTAGPLRGWPTPRRCCGPRGTRTTGARPGGWRTAPPCRPGSPRGGFASRWTGRAAW